MFKIKEKKSFWAIMIILILLSVGIPFLVRFCYLSSYKHRIEVLTAERERVSLLKPVKPLAVIMTTYNRADLLPRAIDSILTQTFKDFDFLIVDDGSKDSSLKLLYEYMKKDERIRVYTQTNKGIFFSRNRLLKIAQNKYVAIMDSDDYSFPERLEKQYTYLEKNQHVTVVTTQSATFDNPDQLYTRWVQRDQELAEYFFRKCPIMDGSTMFRLGFIRQNDLSYDPSVVAGEDYRFWKKILEKGGHFALIEERLLYFREHHTNKKSYYKIMNETVETVRSEFYRLFSDTAVEKPHLSLCERLLKAQEVNKEKHFFTEEQMDYAISQWCPSKDKKIRGYFIMTKVDPFAFQDYIIENENPPLFYRFKTGERVTLKKQTAQEIVMDTPLWKDLTFVPLENTDYWIQK